MTDEVKYSPANARWFIIDALNPPGVEELGEKVPDFPPGVTLIAAKPNANFNYDLLVEVAETPNGDSGYPRALEQLLAWWNGGITQPTDRYFVDDMRDLLKGEVR